MLAGARWGRGLLCWGGVSCDLWFGERGGKGMGRGEGGYQPRKRTLVLGCEGTWCRRRRREAGVAAMVVLVFCVFTKQSTPPYLQNTINSTVKTHTRSPCVLSTTLTPCQAPPPNPSISSVRHFLKRRSTSERRETTTTTTLLFPSLYYNHHYTHTSTHPTVYNYNGEEEHTHTHTQRDTLDTTQQQQPADRDGE